MVKALPVALLTEADRQVLTVAAAAWARFYEATRDVRERGILVEGERGKVKNQALQIARDAEQTLRMCWAELGLTPAARSRLEIPAGPSGGEAARARSDPRARFFT